MLEKLREKAKELNDREIIDLLSDEMCFFKLNIDEIIYILDKLNIKDEKKVKTILELINKESFVGGNL